MTGNGEWGLWKCIRDPDRLITALPGAGFRTWKTPDLLRHNQHSWFTTGPMITLTVPEHSTSCRTSRDLHNGQNNSPARFAALLCHDRSTNGSSVEILVLVKERCAIYWSREPPEDVATCPGARNTRRSVPWYCSPYLSCPGSWITALGLAPKRPELKLLTLTLTSISKKLWTRVWSHCATPDMMRARCCVMI